MEIYCDEIYDEHRVNFILKNDNLYYPCVTIIDSGNPLFEYEHQDELFDEDKCTHEMPDDSLLEVIKSKLLQLESIYNEIKANISVLVDKQNVSLNPLLKSMCVITYNVVASMFVTKKITNVEIDYDVDLDNDTITARDPCCVNELNHHNNFVFTYHDKHSNVIRIKCHRKCDIVIIIQSAKCMISFRNMDRYWLKLDDDAIIKIFRLLEEIKDMNAKGFSSAVHKSAK